jgi:hypothetical protein
LKILSLKKAGLLGRSKPRLGRSNSSIFRRLPLNPSGCFDMGRTLPSITQTFLQEQDAFARFQRAIVLVKRRLY